MDRNRSSSRSYSSSQSYTDDTSDSETRKGKSHSRKHRGKSTDKKTRSDLTESESHRRGRSTKPLEHSKRKRSSSSSDESVRLRKEPSRGHISHRDSKRHESDHKKRDRIHVSERIAPPAQSDEDSNFSYSAVISPMHDSCRRSVTNSEEPLQIPVDRESSKYEEVMRIKNKRDRKKNLAAFDQINMERVRLKNEQSSFEKSMNKRETDVKSKLELLESEEKKYRETIEHYEWWDKRLKEKEAKLLEDCIKCEQSLATLNQRAKKQQEEDDQLSKKATIFKQDETRLHREKQLILELLRLWQFSSGTIPPIHFDKVKEIFGESLTQSHMTPMTLELCPNVENNQNGHSQKVTESESEKVLVEHEIDETTRENLGNVGDQNVVGNKKDLSSSDSENPSSSSVGQKVAKVNSAESTASVRVEEVEETTSDKDKEIVATVAVDVNGTDQKKHKRGHVSKKNKKVIPQSSFLQQVVA